MTAHLGVQIRRAGNHLLSAQEDDSHGWFSGSIQIGPQGAAHAGICCHRASLVGATLCVMLALGGCNHFRDNYSNVGPTPPFATPEPPRQTGEPRVVTTERPHRAAGGDILPTRADSIPFSRSGGGGTTGPGESVGDAPRQSASLPEPLPEPTATLLPEPPAPVGPPTSSPAFPSNLRLSFTAAERIAIFGTGVEVAEIAQPGSRYRYQYSGVRLLTRSADKYLLLPVGWQRGRDAVFMVRDDDSIRVDIAAQ
jgi:hypothetical protein